MSTRRIHYISGLTLTVFIGLHLVNHLSSLWGIATHIELMDSLRLVYRNPFAELLLMGAVLTQIISGIKLFRTEKNIPATWFAQLHRWSGMYLAVFLVIHVGAVMTGRFLLHLDTNFYFGAAGLNSLPFSLFFVPYYGLAVISFFAHIACVHHAKMSITIAGVLPSMQAKAILVTGILVTFIIFYGMTGHFRGVEIPKAYHVLIGQ